MADKARLLRTAPSALLLADKLGEDEGVIVGEAVIGAR
jgi:hypothetical protein